MSNSNLTVNENAQPWKTGHGTLASYLIQPTKEAPTILNAFSVRIQNRLVSDSTIVDSDFISGEQYALSGQ